MNANSLVVFTDLDGSLLDHYDYNHVAADPMLEQLRSCNIPVIPCTSKTRLECESLRAELKNTNAFIIENGAAIFIPHTDVAQAPAGCHSDGQFYIKNMVPEKSHWYLLLERLQTHYGDDFITFDEVGIEGVMKMTGLSHEQARLACSREYGEIFKWIGCAEKYAQFKQEIEAAGAQLLRGGRFLHLTGDTDKGRALKWLMTVYQSQTEQLLVSVALGDSHNDAAMLDSADYAILIRSPAHGLPLISEQPNILITEQTGSEGWVEGMGKLLNTLSIEMD